MAGLGVRQREVLRSAAEGNAWAQHTRHGNLVVHVYDWWHPGEVLTSLLDRGLVEMTPTGPDRWDVTLTAEGRQAFAEIERRGTDGTA